MKRILVIRLGALGDLCLSFGPFAAIRAAHADDEITLLTTAPFAPLAGRAPWFDRVAVDARPAWWNAPGLLRLRRQLAGFDFVYDLQTSDRSSRYSRSPAVRPGRASPPAARIRTPTRAATSCTRWSASANNWKWRASARFRRPIWRG